MSLSVSNLVRVSVNLSPEAAAVRSFGVLMIAGDSNVINGVERYRTYLGIDGVATDFGVNAPEYKAAALYFGQTPKPSTLMIGRWFRVASSGLNDGGILSASEQLITNWTAISAGAFTIVIDGVTVNLTGLDFSGAANLNAVASIITSALSGAGTCVWNGINFVISSTTTGAGASAQGTVSLDTNPSYGVQAHGTITLSGQPTNGDTVTIKGTTVTFVSGTPSGNQVQISVVDDLGTAQNLQNFLQGAADSNLAACTYNTIALVTTITARVYGTAGNAYSLTKSGSNITVSGSGTLASGVAADTLTLNGTAITFVALNPTGNQVLVGPTVQATAANLQLFLQNSQNSNLLQATYATSGTLTTVTAATPGTAGNSYTMAKSSSHISLSGAVLSGGTVPSSVGFATAPGSGTDISALLKLSVNLSQALVPGFNAESPVECAAELANVSAAWYGLMFQASVQPSDDQNIDVCTLIEAQDLTRVFGVTIVNTNVLSAEVTTDLASRMKNGGYRQSFCQYSENAYAIASFFGRAFTVDFTANNTTITLMYKQEPGVVGEDLTANEALVLKNKRCNVFVDYVNDTVIIQYGVMSGPAYFDEIHGLDWLQNAMQTSLYNVLYLTATKIPQTDAGMNKLVNALDAVLGQAVSNGLLAPGVWNADGFGNLNTGDYLKTGYYIYALPVALQSQSDRDARKSTPIQVAAKLAGAIQEIDVLVDVNR